MANTTPAKSTPESPNKNSRIILVVAGILVLSALGFFAIRFFTVSAENEQNLANIEQLNEEILQLEEKILDYENTLEDKNLELAEKNKLLEEKYQELDNLAGRLAQARQNDKANSARIRQLENRVAELRSKADQYQAEIESLRAENMILTGQVDSLRQSTGQLQEENISLSETAARTREELEQTKQKASVLQTIDFRIVNEKKPGKTDEDTKFRRKAIGELKTCFTVLENLVASTGSKDFFMVWEQPDGTILTNSQSSTFDYQGEPIQYSAKNSVYYDRTRQEICVGFTPEEDQELQKGQQFVSVYADGNLIGQSNFELR